MGSELRFKEDIEDHTMTRVLKKGFKFLINLATSIKDYMLKIISKFVKEVIDGSVFSTLSKTFRDKNVCVIDSGDSIHMMM